MKKIIIFCLALCVVSNGFGWYRYGYGGYHGGCGAAPWVGFGVGLGLGSLLAPLYSRPVYYYPADYYYYYPPQTVVLGNIYTPPVYQERVFVNNITVQPQQNAQQPVQPTQTVYPKATYAQSTQVLTQYVQVVVITQYVGSTSN
jgi:hypothetical protein